MKSLVIYDSVFGNTEEIARAVGKALEAGGSASVVAVLDANAAMLEDVDLVVAASPTRGFKPMPSITKFLDELSDGALAGKKAAAFDTRIDLETIKPKLFRFIVSKAGYADKALAKLLQNKGGQLVEPTAGFFVDDSEGPISMGELDRAVEWAKALISE